MRKVMLQCFFLLCSLAFVFGWSVSCSPPPSNGNDGGITEKKVVKEGACQFNSECACNQTCNRTAGQCKEIQCQSNSECRCNWLCVKGVCYEPSKAPCQTDKDCTNAKLWKCETSTGKCIDGGCRKDADCTDPAKPMCDTANNTCKKRPCATDGDCKDPTKPLCKAGDCIADDGAALGEACSDQKKCQKSLTCAEDEGKKICCKSCNPFGGSGTCSNGKECIRTSNAAATGLCLSPGNGVKEGEDCSGGKACQKHLRCAFDGENETCRRECLSNDGCARNKESCRSYGKNTQVCLPAPPPCGPGRSCPGESNGSQQCVNGTCQIRLCPDQFKCPATEKCQKNGRCVPRNCPTEKCDPLYKCVNNRCVETNEGKRCGDNLPIGAKDCGDGLMCARVGYITACVRPCDTDKCETGFSCVLNVDKQKICMQTCPGNGKCKYTSYFCKQYKRIYKASYCMPPGQPSGSDLLESCNKTKACLPDLQCYQNYRGTAGYCIKRGCTSSADCDGIAGAICADDYSFGKGCYAKSTCTSFSACSVNGVSGRCTRGKQRNYYCRPS